MGLGRREGRRAERVGQEAGGRPAHSTSVPLERGAPASCPTASSPRRPGRRGWRTCSAAGRLKRRRHPESVGRIAGNRASRRLGNTAATDDSSLLLLTCIRGRTPGGRRRRGRLHVCRAEEGGQEALTTEQADRQSLDRPTVAPPLAPGSTSFMAQPFPGVPVATQAGGRAARRGRGRAAELAGRLRAVGERLPRGRPGQAARLLESACEVYMARW